MLLVELEEKLLCNGAETEADFGHSCPFVEWFVLKKKNHEKKEEKIQQNVATTPVGLSWSLLHVCLPARDVPVPALLLTV